MSFTRLSLVINSSELTRFLGIYDDIFYCIINLVLLRLQIAMPMIKRFWCGVQFVSDSQYKNVLGNFFGWK